jgi:NAD(P) transhydrogenase subunit alpha
VRAAVLRERRPGERRVAATPESVAKLAAAGWSVAVEAGAGHAAGFPDTDYAVRGADVTAQPLPGADVLLAVAPPDPALPLPPGLSVLGLLEPSAAAPLWRALAAVRGSAYALELLPRTSRAQSMDALSSQALVAGYRAVVEAALRYPRFFPLAMTAAGTVPPAKVFVLGAGVAGLQAIATARRLGAVVSANDVRQAAAEEVRSLGATFVDVAGGAVMEGAGGYAREASEAEIVRQRERLAEHVAAADVVITTAAVPGRRAPRLLTTEMLLRMRPGSVVIDLAAETGGNVEGSRPGADVLVGGATLYGARQIASTMPAAASALYARNVQALLLLMTRNGAFAPDHDDDLVAGTCVLRDGVPAHDLVREALA